MNYFPISIYMRDVVINIEDIIGKVILIEMKGSTLTNISIPLNFIKHD
jgi:hypothetical protein